MDIKTRVRNILLTPNTEWPVIAEEPTDKGAVVTGYVMPLAAIGAIAGFIGGPLVRHVAALPRHVSGNRSWLGLTGAVIAFVLAIVGVFILCVHHRRAGADIRCAERLEQGLQGRRRPWYTPAWIAGALQIVPGLGILGVLAALYALYLLYLGLPALMKVPQEKAIGYTAVVVVCAIVLSIVVTSIAGLVVAPAALAGMGLLIPFFPFCRPDVRSR